ncbi:serine/arginine repetitive matrix protein 2-like [Sycon ciliatum]|uniref:serine/arginine repetitive matrix protein 2-like n=1 Tax=Sycon ciliatum TaxID=27933 RepID=UPI0031F64FF1
METSSSPSSTSSPKDTSSSPSNPSNTTENSSSPSNLSNTTENSPSPSNPTKNPLTIQDPPSQLKEIHSIRLSSALAAINVKAPKQEEGVVELFIQYTSVECRGNKRWNCSRHRVTSCSQQDFFFWQCVESSCNDETK